MTRQLTKEEKELSEKNIRISESNIKFLEDDMKNLEFKLNFQLEHNYYKLKRKTQNDLNEIKRTIKQTNAIIAVTKQQIEYGVDKKQDDEGEE